MKTGLPTIFKSPGHKRFEFKPRYWDEQKERKAELERMVEEARTGRVSDDRRVEKLRQEHTSKWGSKRGTRATGGSSQSLRFLMIFGMLAGLVWLFLNWGQN